MHDHDHDHEHGQQKKFAVDEETVRQHAEWMAGEGGTRTSRLARRLSERVSRRSALSRLGAWTMGITGVALVGSLPVTRTAQAAPAAPAVPGADAAEPLIEPFVGSNPAECEYWRWCSMDGTPCASCAGGGVTTCAPGSKPGAEFWVGCCTEPTSGKTYLIAYYDCCGAPSCAASFCGEPDAQAVMYNPVPGSYDQEIIWCVSDESQSYTCTMAPIIGEDCTPRPAARPKVGAGA